MIWAPRVNPIKIRRLYRTARLGIYDDDALQTVGWELYARCADIATVADVFPEGRVPCPLCRTKVKRKIDALFRKSIGNPHDSWFHCSHCAKRLLWQDCRDALRKTPRCFDCGARLQSAPTGKRSGRTHGELHCTCGKTWTWEAYRRSIRARLRLPCPHCHHLIRRRDAAVSRERKEARLQSAPTGERKEAHVKNAPTGERKEAHVKNAPTGERDELHCPKCNGTALHETGYIHCTACGYKRRWRDYRKSLKKRDETLHCKACGHTFRWQAWRKSARSLRTGNPQPAREFAEKWPKCRTPQARMMRIDSLLQALHGRGALAPLFIDGNEERIRQMLDEFAEQL